MATRILDDQQRFWRYVWKTETCWLWLGRCSQNGYGRFQSSRASGKQAVASTSHRFSWLYTNGPIPDGLRVLHKCDNRICVRPDHLFLGTDLDNARDRASKGRNGNLKGSRNGQSKLIEDEVRAIKTDSRIADEIAADYKVSPATIRGIKLGYNWKHVRLMLGS